MSNFLQQYRDNHMNRVEGFSHISAIYVLEHLSLLNETESILEIGVHHGQFFIALNQLSTQKGFAIDVFDNQHMNIDKSGEGNYRKFLQNLDEHDVKHRGKNVIIIEGDSLEPFTQQKVHDYNVGFSYISIDGGHTPAHVMNDLSFASKILASNGIVILDDYFNHWWPSVTEGLVHYLNTTPSLVPFATSNNKMWLCRITNRQKFINHMLKIENFGKTPTSFFGHNILDLW
jgi:hypothetical protein